MDPGGRADMDTLHWQQLLGPQGWALEGHFHQAITEPWSIGKVENAPDEEQGLLSLVKAKSLSWADIVQVPVVQQDKEGFLYTL